MTEDQLDRLGKLADKADSFAVYAKGPFAERLSAAMRFDALHTGLLEIRREVVKLYNELGGDPDTWPESYSDRASPRERSR
jgi:hypothetical protein